MIQIVRSVTTLKVRLLTNSPIISGLLTSQYIKIRMSGRTMPFPTCEKYIILSSGKFGSSTTPAAITIIAVKSPKNCGASCKFLSMPSSHTIPSQMQYAVDNGRIETAKMAELNNPNAKSQLAYSPAKGFKANAASLTVSTRTPALNNVAAQATTIKNATIHATTHPTITSSRTCLYSSALIFFSTIVDCR